MDSHETERLLRDLRSIREEITDVTSSSKRVAAMLSNISSLTGYLQLTVLVWVGIDLVARFSSSGF